MATNYVYSLALNWSRGTPHEVAAAGKTPLQYAARPDLDRELGAMFRLADAQAGELLLVRHAEPDTGARHRYCGDEPALTVTGRVQARFLAGRLTEDAIDAIYSAPERYAEETASHRRGGGRGADADRARAGGHRVHAPGQRRRRDNRPRSSPPTHAGTRYPASRRAESSGVAPSRPSRRCWRRTGHSASS